MRKLVLLITLLLISTGVLAQGSTPGTLISLLEAGDFRALAVTSDQRYLLVADTATNQVRIYDLRTPADPALIDSISLEDSPSKLAAADQFALVLTSTANRTSTVEVIAPARYRTDSLFIGGYNYVDLSFEAQQLVVASDYTHALALGANQYSLMQLNSADDIEATTFDGTLSTAAISHNLLIYGSGSQAVVNRLNGNNPPEAITTHDFASRITAITLNASGDLGAIALSSGEVSLFDPATLEVLGSVDLQGTPSLLQFGTANREPRLAVVMNGQSEVIVLDASDQTLQPFDNPLSMSGAIHAITAFTNHLVVTDGSEIAIFALP